MQEDELVEWATFWAFAFAAIAWALHFRRERGVPWFAALVCLACLFVAGEELSWGQRLAGFRPPAFFLRHNFQQELNVHNLPGSEFRRLLIGLGVAGYGLVLPALVAVPPIGRAFAGVGIVAPPRWLVLGFAATLALYLGSPMPWSGEIVELGFGLCVLLAAWDRLGTGPRRTALLLGLFAALSVGATRWSRAGRAVDPALAATALRELDALRADVSALGLTRGKKTCGLHRRLYTFARTRDGRGMREGGFPRAGGERRAYFLDPWNSPYWIRHECEKGRQLLTVYSFGPNRIRESTAWAAGGDDLRRSVPRLP